MTAADDIAEPADLTHQPDEARDALIRGLYARVHQSVLRRTPFMSTSAAKALAEDVSENVSDYLKGAFDL